MGKTIDFQQQKDLRVWRTVMEALHAIQNLEPWTFLGPEDTFLYLPKAENRWIFFRWVPAAPNEVVLTVYPSGLPQVPGDAPDLPGKHPKLHRVLLF